MIFKSLGGTSEQLCLIYLTRVRSTLEFGASILHSGLTKEQSMKVEKVQKKALVIILGSEYQNYKTAVHELIREA